MDRRIATLLVAASCTGSPGGGDAMQDGDACAHAALAPIAVGTIAPIETAELSGLAASHALDGVLWAHGDGGSAELYAIGAANAAVRGALHLPDARAVDWEDVATAPCAAGHCIYAADIGDNQLDRTSVAIFEVAEPRAPPIGTADASFTEYEIRYPDGPHDSEALFVDPRDGASYDIIKVADPHAVVYALPRTAGAPAIAVEIGALAIPSRDPRVTAADMAVDACSARILVRSHDALYELRGSATASVPELLRGALATMPVADEVQGEAVAYAADGRAYFTTGEGADPVLFRVSD